MAEVVALQAALITSATHSSVRVVVARRAGVRFCGNSLLGMAETLRTRAAGNDPVSATPGGTAGCTTTGVR
jgi:hypothetical protein